MLLYNWCDGHQNCPGHLEEEADGCRPGRYHSSCSLVLYMIVEIIPHNILFTNVVSIGSVLAIRLSVR